MKKVLMILSLNELRQHADQLRSAAMTLGASSHAERQAFLRAIGPALGQHRDAILKANREDLEIAQRDGCPPALLDRLRMKSSAFDHYAANFERLATLPDPLEGDSEKRVLENGLRLRRRARPLGIVGIIYEARPEVAIEASALCVKGGNVLIVRGSSHAQRTSALILESIQIALENAQLPQDSVIALSPLPRENLTEFVQLNEIVDVIIVRGGEPLLRLVRPHATVPLIEAGAGNCHVYVGASADLEMATRIVLDAKLDRPAVCNAAETLLIDSDWGRENCRALLERLAEHNVQIRGCEQTREIFPEAAAATEDDWYKEHLDSIMTVRVVSGVQDAGNHIVRYGSKHSEAIVTSDQDEAMQFFRLVDSGAVYWNVSTRFTGGGEFGLGGELGVSTQKLHVRGPIGAYDLVSRRYELVGDGHIRDVSKHFA